MSSPRVVAVLVGRPRIVQGDDPWLTAFYKESVVGPIQLGPTNLEGDEQADPRVHGGPDKAVCVYAADHLDAWRREHATDAYQPGAFGENFSVTGQTERTVSVGDVFGIGTARVQVAQPRGPCWKIGRRWSRPDFPREVAESGRTGWYLRVLLPGVVEAGQPLVLEDRPFAEWSIERVNTLTYGDQLDRSGLAALAACPALAVRWRAHLEKALAT